MKREKGYIINHIYANSVKREVHYTKEVLFIKSGKVRVDFYDENKILRVEFKSGRCYSPCFWGHSFKMLNLVKL